MEYKDVIMKDQKLSDDQQQKLLAHLQRIEPVYLDEVKQNISNGGVDMSEPTLSENARTILERRYLLKDPVTDKPIETPAQMFARVALKLSLVDLPYKLKEAVVTKDLVADEDVENHTVNETLFHFIQYYNIMRRGEFIPAGRTLANEKHSVPNWYRAYVSMVMTN